MDFFRVHTQKFAAIRFQIKSQHLLFILKKFPGTHIDPFNSHRIDEMQLISDLVTYEQLAAPPKLFSKLLRDDHQIVFRDLRDLNVPCKLLIGLTCLFVHTYELVGETNFGWEEI
jgi:hypothetical protein